MLDARKFTDYYKGLSSAEAADFNDELRKQTRRTHSAISRWRCGLTIPSDPLVLDKWKRRARVTPEAKEALTPDNIF